MILRTLGTPNHGRQPLRFRRTSPSEANLFADLLTNNHPEEVFEKLIDAADESKLEAGNYNKVVTDRFATN